MNYKHIIAKLLGIHPDEIDRYVEGRTMIFVTYRFQTYKYKKVDLDRVIMSTQKERIAEK